MWKARCVRSRKYREREALDISSPTLCVGQSQCIGRAVVPATRNFLLRAAELGCPLIGRKHKLEAGECAGRRRKFATALKLAALPRSLIFQ